MRIVCLLLITAGLLGCGSGASPDPNAERPPKDQFAGTCGSCHTLADAGTSGTFGPNLDDLAPDKARVLAAIAGGPGAMPSGLLEGAAADGVAEYVASVAGSDG